MISVLLKIKNSTLEHYFKMKLMKKIAKSKSEKIFTSVSLIFLPLSSVLSAFLMHSIMSSRVSNSTFLIRKFTN